MALLRVHLVLWCLVACAAVVLGFVTRRFCARFACGLPWYRWMFVCVTDSRYGVGPGITSVTPNGAVANNTPTTIIIGLNTSVTDPVTCEWTSGGGQVAGTLIQPTAVQCLTPSTMTPATSNLTVEAGVLSATTSGFTFYTQNTVGSVSPASGPTTLSSTVTIVGTGFASYNSLQVKFGATVATSVTLVDSATIVVVAPTSAATTSVTVAVADNGVTYSTDLVSFVYYSTTMRASTPTGISQFEGGGGSWEGMVRCIP